MALTYTLNGTDLGVVQDEFSNKVSQFFEVNGPQDDSSDLEVIEVGGAIRTITINGRKVDSLANMRTFVNTFNGLVDGSQDTTIAFVNGFLNTTINVKIKSFDYNYGEGMVAFVDYTFVLVEAAT